MQAMMA